MKFDIKGFFLHAIISAIGLGCTVFAAAYGTGVDLNHALTTAGVAAVGALGVSMKSFNAEPNKVTENTEKDVLKDNGV